MHPISSSLRENADLDFAPEVSLNGPLQPRNESGKWGKGKGLETVVRTKSRRRVRMREQIFREIKSKMVKL
jgi:hypothetical protein